ncbi:MAG: hypothetical protein HC804_01235 [Anaerolineae bacterium]|nr:hypothetical protein [Anaerolineae bacterium]
MTTAPTSTSSRPVVLRATPLDWLKKNLFSNWYNSLISVLLLWLIGSTLYSTLVLGFHHGPLARDSRESQAVHDRAVSR